MLPPLVAVEPLAMTFYILFYIESNSYEDIFIFSHGQRWRGFVISAFVLDCHCMACWRGFIIRAQYYDTFLARIANPRHLTHWGYDTFWHGLQIRAS
jgi:hypothetical protein